MTGQGREAGQVLGLVVVQAQDLAALVMDSVTAALAFGGERASPALLDRARLAQALAVSTSTVDRLVARGMPHLLVADAKRFELDSVVTWLRSCKEAP